ncbi:MAG: hypothetical protein NDI93_01390 [Pseudomonas sp.]|nr:hypothetical protein [Pseudomonas sp.]
MGEVDFHTERYQGARRLHDVPYLSRYGYHEELVEMERFIRAAAAEHLEGYLRGLFYDSRSSACLCDIETVEGLLPSDPEGERLFQAATANISQFQLFGIIGHRLD